MTLDQIVVATDFSPASISALLIANRVARIFQAKVTVLHVFQYLAQHRYKVPVDWMIKTIRREVQEKLAEDKRSLCEAGIESEVRMIEGGVPAQEILNFAQSCANPLLVIGTHAVGGMERFVLGSTAEEVLRQASCPVMTVGPHVSVPTCINPYFHKILYATDFSEASLAAVPLVIEFQRPSAASIRILHVSNNTDPQSIAEEQRFDPIRKTLSEGLDHLCVGSEEYVISQGEVISQVVVNEADHFPADLLILGVRRASAYAAHVSPKTAFQIIAAAPCPVLSVSS
ncbi:universal stress protein [Edaphobacter aggregans]|uniref:universal stress protein n=1 Tax=Edaphobacter aggregans TaxID=570835 RepID=UPI0005542B08|nr:universal stress protein [Edaphobacter aggregans]